MSAISPMIQQMRGPLETTPLEMAQQNKTGQLASGKESARAMGDSLTGENSLEISAGNDSVTISEEGRAMQQRMAADKEAGREKDPDGERSPGAKESIAAAGLGKGEEKETPIEEKIRQLREQIKEVKDTLEEATQRLADATAASESAGGSAPTEQPGDPSTQAAEAMGQGAEAEAIQAEIDMLNQQLQMLYQQLQQTIQGAGGGGAPMGSAGIGGSGGSGGAGERISVSA